MTFELTYKPFGDRAILVEWPQEINEAILNDIIRFKDSIERKKIKSIIELKSAYNSLLIVYDVVCRNFENEVNQLKKAYKAKNTKSAILSKLWKIPVCYDDDFGIDLALISAEKKLSKTEIIKRHSQAIYTVYFIGFLPGFLYLGGLDEALHFPRKSTPRLQIKKGAVAIGGNQTGVYPNESPGGWNIIGNSPINFFDVANEEPCFAKSGDRIQFCQVSLKEHKNIIKLVEIGVYQMESEVLHG